MNNSILLLKTLLLSTSQRNIFRYCKDKKKRRKIIGGFIGAGLLYLMLMAFCVLMCIGYGMTGIIEAVPVMCALTISALAFMFTLFKTNGYLFNFREYDMLMSLPFEPRTVAAGKFMYMYVKSLPWYLSISLAMLIGYGAYAHPGVLVYPEWVILSLFIPVIPMLISAFLGFLTARISAGFRKTNIIQTVITMAFVIFCFSLRFIIEDLFRNDKVQSTLEKSMELSGSAADMYLPAGWFSDAVIRQNAAAGLLLIGVSCVLFAVVFAVVGSSYMKINSALRSHAASGKYRMSAQKKRSVVSAVAFKEYKRMTGSSAYMVNGMMGEILAVLLGILTLLIGFERIVGAVTQNAPFDYAILQPAIPFIIYFFIGMVATTACSPSLEGRNYWIIQSLPIEKKDLYKGKMLFNMYLAVPAMAFATLCMCISAGVPLLDSILYLILGFSLCAFSTAWGCVCGIKHMRLDWENEIEVIKQSPAVAIYMLPNMFVVMGLTVLVVFLGIRTDHRLLAAAFILITTVLAVLSYVRVMKLSRRG
ncbi:MAG: hypothetical protein IJJ31_02915 [Mogibacterium sp.]|nr:hypothetical protein [Mogibacterium sp.]